MNIHNRQLIVTQLERSLLGSCYLVHFLPKETYRIISIKLEFGASEFIVIRNDADGDALIIESHQPEEMILDEYGEIKLISSMEYDPARSRSCLGRRFSRCRLLIGSREQIRGVELNFEGRIMSFYNLDDQLEIGKSLDDIGISDRGRLLEIG